MSVPPTYAQFAAEQAAVVKVLKARFPNLSVEETLTLANQILLEIGQATLEKK